MRLKDRAESVCALLAKLDRPIVDRLIKPASDQELDDLEIKSGLKIPEALKELYRWRAGTDIPPARLVDENDLIPGFVFLSISEAMACYQSLCEAGVWNLEKSWFPFLGNYAGDYYCIECNEGTVHHGEIAVYRRGDPNVEFEFESLKSFLDTVIECYERGAYFVDENGYLEVDDDRYYLIAMKHNRSLPYYQNPR